MGALALKGNGILKGLDSGFRGIASLSALFVVLSKRTLKQDQIPGASLRLPLFSIATALSHGVLSVIHRHMTHSFLRKVS